MKRREKVEGALRKTSFSWVHLGPFKFAVTSLDILAAFSLKQALLWTLLCYVPGDLKGQEVLHQRREQGQQESAAKGTETGSARNEGPLFAGHSLGPLCCCCQLVTIVSCQCLWPSFTPPCRRLGLSDPPVLQDLT